jgi:hydroxyacylglutathione hydrolase
MSLLKFKGIELGPIGTNAYVIWKHGQTDCVLVDAPPQCKGEIEAFLQSKNLSLREMWLTHGHWDHMAGAESLNSENIHVIGHKDDQVMFEQPEIMSAFAIPGLQMQPIQVDTWISHGGELNFLGSSVEVRHCPGHCPGNVVFWFKDEKVCFVGDVIFRESVGRYDLPGGDMATLRDSILKNIYSLPDDTILCPGHGPTTTVGYEKTHNPFVRP